MCKLEIDEYVKKNVKRDGGLWDMIWYIIVENGNFNLLLIRGFTYWCGKIYL